MTDLRQHVADRIAEALGVSTEAEKAAIQLTPPKNRAHGDVALGMFQLAKMRGIAPPALAEELCAKLADGDAVIESVQTAGPFVNIRYRRAALAEQMVGGVLTDAAPFGPATPSGRTIVIDFSSPNIAKPFHMGHLRSTVIGASLCRIHRHVGDTVHGVNHLCDWGMPFAKMMTAWMRFGDEAELKKAPIRHMFDLYVRYGQEVKQHPELDAEAAAHFKALESGEDNE